MKLGDYQSISSDTCRSGADVATFASYAAG